MVTAIFVQNILRPLLDRSLAQKQGRVYVYFYIDGNDLMHCHILFSFVPMAMSLCVLSFNNQTVNWLPQTEKGICIVKADCSPVFSVPGFSSSLVSRRCEQVICYIAQFFS